MALPTSKEYSSMVKKASPNSHMGKNLLLAFLIGGAICAVGQAVRGFFESLDLSPENLGAATSCIMVFLGSFFTAVGLYDKLAKYGGAGTLVPITGFANAVSAPAVEFRAEGVITGVCAKMFTIAGPVIVLSVVSGILYGLILLIFGAG